ncbi:hypothetical protein, partial [Bacillus cereus]
YNQLFSSLDKSHISAVTQSPLDALSVHALIDNFDQWPITQDLTAVIDILKQPPERVDRILSVIYVRTSGIYIEAKKYVLAAIRENHQRRASSTQLLLTREDMYRKLLNDRPDLEVKEAQLEALREELYQFRLGEKEGILPNY